MEINISPPVTPEKAAAPARPVASGVDPKPTAASAAKAAAAPDEAPPKAPSLKERAQAIERGAAPTERGASLPAQQPAVKDPPVRQERERERSAAPPPAPTAAPPPPATKSDAEDVDDESILVLPDGRQIEAKKIEQVRPNFGYSW